MAVPAIDTHPAGVVGMAELDRLLDKFVLFCRPRGPHQGEDQPPEEQNETEDAEQRRARQCVRTARKNLAHNRPVWRPKPMPRTEFSEADFGRAPDPKWRLYNVKCFTNLSNQPLHDCH